MNLSVIVIMHNDVGLIKKCLFSLSQNERGIVEIIIIDNHSTDNTPQVVEENFPQVKLIKNSGNLGVARARNQGIKQSTGDYVMLLDADAELKPNSIEYLIAEMEQNPEIGIVAPKLVYPDGTLQYSCRRFPTLWNILGRGLNAGLNNQNEYLMKGYDHQTPREVDWVMGACQIIRRKMLDEIGLLDEKYFFGHEDVDLCWRAWQKRWKVVYEPSAVVIHHYQRRSARGGIFNPLKWSHFFSAMRFLIKKNFS